MMETELKTFNWDIIEKTEDVELQMKTFHDTLLSSSGPDHVQVMSRSCPDYVQVMSYTHLHLKSQGLDLELTL